jgi:hypothetical protein
MERDPKTTFNQRAGVTEKEIADLARFFDHPSKIDEIAEIHDKGERPKRVEQGNSGKTVLKVPMVIVKHLPEQPKQQTSTPDTEWVVIDGEMKEVDKNKVYHGGTIR